jgi:hypothetical protein
MGADYYLVPTAIASQYPWAIEQLDRHAMQWPEISGAGRNLKPSEVRAVLDILSDYSISYSVSEDNWQAEIHAAQGIRFLRPNALLNAVDYAGDEATACLFCLEKGDPRLNLLIAERLSRICGPLFLIPDTGAHPLLVTPGSDPAQLMRNWTIR